MSQPNREEVIAALTELVSAVIHLANTGSYPADHYKRRLVEPVVDALLGEPDLGSGDQQ